MARRCQLSDVERPSEPLLCFLVLTLAVASPPPPSPTTYPLFEQAVFASLAEEFGGTTKVVRGDELLKDGDSYPMVSGKG